MKKALKITIVVAMLGIVGCTTTSPLQTELATGGVPKFDGYITPIKVPVLLRYEPTEVRVNSSTAISISTGQQSAKSVHVEISGKYKIQKLGDMLTMDIMLDNLMFNGRTTEVGPATLRVLMDTRGSVREVELIGSNLTKAKQKERAEIIKSIKYLPVLPAVPVRSGDTIQTGGLGAVDLGTAGAEIAKLLEFLADAEYTVDGWSVVNGRKLMVTSIDERKTKRVGKNTVQLIRSGYQLWDVDMVQVVKSRVLMAVTSKNAPNTNIKILTHITQL